MSVIVNAVFPLFALILLGYISARRRLLGPGAVDSLNKFVVWLALAVLTVDMLGTARRNSVARRAKRGT